MAGAAAFVLSSELISYVFKFIYGFEPAFERIPLHLCGSLKIALTVLILFRRFDLVKHISTWAIGAGLISFVNLNLGGKGFSSFMFWHYLWGHYYLFLAPILLFLAGEYRYDITSFAKSMLGLFLWSLAIFFANWIFDTNWMFTGPHNTTAVPFIPVRFMVWPLNYLSYVMVALILLVAVYAVLRISQARMDRTSRGDGPLA